jgi:hypothetical protein
MLGAYDEPPLGVDPGVVETADQVMCRPTKDEIEAVVLPT